jgi:hypothetical protein
MADVFPPSEAPRFSSATPPPHPHFSEAKVPAPAEAPFRPILPQLLQGDGASLLARKRSQWQILVSRSAL